MSTATVATRTPSVWIGCLSCYVVGRLVGDWYPANRAGAVTLAQLHGAVTPCVTSCDREEMWCMDTGYLPVDREMSPYDAQRWGDLVNELGIDHLAALHAWMATNTHVVDGNGMPCGEDFWDRCVGEFDSWRDFVEHTAGEYDLLDQVPEHLRDYVDLEAWGRVELGESYVARDALDGGVFVFGLR